MRVVLPRFARLHEVLGDIVAARVRDKLGLLCFKQSLLMTHFSSTQQWRSALRVVWRTALTTVAFARRSSEDVYIHTCVQELSPISEKFTIATAFSNVHGVYKAGNVKLQTELLETFQKYASEKVGPLCSYIRAEGCDGRRDGGFLPVVFKAWRSIW